VNSKENQGGHMAKGSSFEREICKQLSLWWTEGKRDDVFWRTSTSGGRATQRSKFGQSTFGQYGDVQATDPIGQLLVDTFTIELKRGYSKSTFFDMFDKPDTAAQQMWDQFLCQVLKDTKDAESLFWMLIVKRDRRNAVVMVPFSFAQRIPELKSIPHSRGIVKLKNGCKIRFYLTKLDQFLINVLPNDVKEICNWTKFKIPSNATPSDIKNRRKQIIVRRKKND